jgi:hypothetical protein
MQNRSSFRQAPHKGQVLLVIFACSVAACADVEVPPPAAPSKSLPRVALPGSQPRREHGNVVLDADSEPATVTEVAGSLASSLGGRQYLWSIVVLSLQKPRPNLSRTHVGKKHICFA